jgi:hypothetical protein
MAGHWPKRLPLSILIDRDRKPVMNLEVVRKTARSALGYRSPTYRLGARILTQYQILRREGWSTMRQLDRIMRTSQRSQMALNLCSLRYPIVVRVVTDDVPTVVNRGYFD